MCLTFHRLGQTGTRRPCIVCISLWFFTFQTAFPLIAAVKADRKSESQLRTTSQPHATYAAVHRSRLPAPRLCALKSVAADLGAASLTKVERLVLASDLTVFHL